MSKQTALLGIMEIETFKARTKANTAVGGFFSKFQSRGGGMAAIDLALEAWSRDCDSSIAASVKQAHVAAIAQACDDWFKQKAQLGKSTDLSEARGQVIAEVRRSCIAAFQYLKNKSSAEAKTPVGMATKRGAVKSLGAGYAHERADYLAGNKQQNPFSASAVDELAPHTLGTMDFAQFSETASGAGVDRVEFLNREQRLAHLVVIQNRLLYQNGDLMQQDYFPQYTEPTIYADTYAVDVYGNIYSKKIKMGAVRFNHSSYCAGKAVLAAGTIACYEGKPLYISNMSGHYRPNTAYLVQFLRILCEESVDLSNTLVDCMDTKRSVMAMSLLQSATAPTDWPHWNGDMPRIMVRGKLTAVENPA